MAQLGRILDRPLTRVVCLNHQAELPFRAVFKKLDGQTTGQSSFSGPIGQMPSGPVHDLAVVKFKPLTGDELPELPPAVVQGLSNDLRLLMECAACVVSGDGSPVQHRLHGQLSMARWQTAQSRLPRVYMSEAEPSPELTTLAMYVVNVDVPTVMAIRHHPDIVEAAKHLYSQLDLQRRYLTGSALVTAQHSLCCNSHMAHPEAVILAMLGDERR